MMEIANIAEAFLAHGAVGLLALVLLGLYGREKVEVRRLNDEITKLQSAHSEKSAELAALHHDQLLLHQERKVEQLDKVRLHQIEREQEFAQAMKAVGDSAIDAIDKCETIAKELRRLHHERLSR